MPGTIALSYSGTARRLGLDRRTIKAKIDGELLGRLRGELSEEGEISRQEA